MINQVEAADFVLVVCTEIYDLRFRGKGERKKGLGANWEGAIITQEIYDAGGRNDKFIPVFFSTEDAAHIPIALRAVTRYIVSDQARNEGLYRHLTNQPGIIKPPLGPLRAMPPLERRQSFPALEVGSADAPQVTESTRTQEKRTAVWRAWVPATLLMVFIVFPFILAPHIPRKPIYELSTLACGLIAASSAFFFDRANTIRNATDPVAPE